MKQNELQKGKRYWFRNINQIYSGLYDGMENEHLARLVRKNGDVWAIPPINIFETKEKCIGKLKHVIVIE